MGLFTYDMTLEHIPEPLVLGIDWEEDDLEEEEQLDALWQVGEGGTGARTIIYKVGGPQVHTASVLPMIPTIPFTPRNTRTNGLRTPT